MIGRRRFLGLATLGLTSSSLIRGELLAQDPKPKSKTKSKAKASAKTKAADSGPTLEADEQVNRILSQARTDGRRLPGMIGAIVHGEKLTSIGAVGIRKIGSPDLMRVDDLVHLGSCTKAMTATMIGTLVDEGKIRWNSTVAEVFPESAGDFHPDYASVTLDQLLRHRGGLPHDLDWWQTDRGLSIVDQRRSLMIRALREAPESKPGADYTYSNTGYVLAGMMAEQVSRRSWEVLIQQRVFGPLKMATAGFGAPGAKGRLDQPWGHRASGNLVEAVREDNAPVMGPAGTVHCSMSDWARFAAYHLKGELDGVRLVKPETLKTLHTPRPGEEYAGGWLVFDRSWAGGRALTHSGSNTTWYGTVWIAPARDFALLAAVNAGGPPAEQACDQAISGMVRLVTRDDPPPRRRRP